jgi:hypothetical protein
MLASGVVEAATKSQAPITSIFSNNFLDWPGKPADERVLFTTLRTGYDFTKTMGIPMREGRDFSEAFKSDTAAMVVNQTAVDIMGLVDPLGQKLTWGDRSFEIIGVTEDVLMGSVFRQVPPMFVVLMPNVTGFISIRLQATTSLPESIAKVEKIVSKYNPAYPFEYTFADTEFNKKFTAIDQVRKLSNVFAFLAIFITCLGLFGLAAFTAEQRTKEIGIRKVLGATIPGIVILISRDFSRLVLLAFLVAGPLAWWIMDTYLQRYAYRIDIPLWVLPVSGGVALLLTLMIVSTQAIRAASANPVNSLRSE